METGPSHSSSLPEALETWLKDHPVRCSETFNESLRGRLRAPRRDLDATLDALLQIQPALHDPALHRKIRAKLDATTPRAEARWIPFLRPLAAAALLSLTFWGFQQEPASRPLDASELAAQPSGLRPVEEADLHLIFALASSLEAETNLAQLEASPDHWAFLLD